ncbi:MAG: transketolase C-terminal domain-containing protein, partial [Chlamydiales bacterium]
EVLVEGEELLIIALGHMNQTALTVSAQLLENGIKSSVLDPIFVKPLDSELICRLLLTHQKIVTIEEHSAQAGMGSIINNFLMRQGFSNVQVLNLGVPETFLEHGSHQNILNEIGLTPDKIVKQIMSAFYPASIKELSPV